MHSFRTKNRPDSNRLNHDSPLTERNKKTEINLGEYIVLKNTSGRNLALGDVEVGQGEDWWQFSASDTIEPNAYALICYGTSADQTEFLSANNLPTTLTSDASVQWHWQNTVTFADVEGQTAIRLYENGKAGTTLDQLYWNSEGLQAINAHCDATCQAAPNREAVQSLQLDDFSYDPVNPWDESKWTTAEATAKGKGSSQPEAPTAVRGLLKKEYELKDHLGNVHVVVTDRKHSTIGAGPSIGEFKADVVVMRDYYPGACPERSRRGMEMEGQGYAAGDYRYGFNGMERDDEMKGSGDSYDFGARMYDPRVGRWMSRDPLEGKYAGMSSYGFVNNMPIIAIDPDGKDIWIVVRWPMQSEKVSGVPYSSSGHMTMCINTYKSVQIKVKAANGEVVSQTYWVKNGFATIENFAGGVDVHPHELSDITKTFVGSSTVAYLFDENKGARKEAFDKELNPGLDDQFYYSEEEVSGEQSMLQYAKDIRATSVYTHGSINGQKQNDCSSLMIDLLKIGKFQIAGAEFGKTTIEAKDGNNYSLYTPNQIGLDLEKIGSCRYVFPFTNGSSGGQNYKYMTKENAEKYVKEEVDTEIGN